jgi:hypothetical protein
LLIPTIAGREEPMRIPMGSSDNSVQRKQTSVVSQIGIYEITFTLSIIAPENDYIFSRHMKYLLSEKVAFDFRSHVFTLRVLYKKLPRNWVILGRRSKLLHHDVGDKK